MASTRRKPLPHPRCLVCKWNGEQGDSLLTVLTKADAARLQGNRAVAVEYTERAYRCADELFVSDPPEGDLQSPFYSQIDDELLP